MNADEMNVENHLEEETDAKRRSTKNLSIIPLAVLAIVVLICFIMATVSYLGLSNSKKDVDESLANVKTAYSEKLELMPSIVDLAARAKMKDKTILDEVVYDEARVKDTDFNKHSKFFEKDTKLSESLDKLMKASEDDPTLKDNKKWNNLEKSLADKDSKVQESVEEYNKNVNEYNKKVLSFPSKYVADKMNLEKAEHFN